MKCFQMQGFRLLSAVNQFFRQSSNAVRASGLGVGAGAHLPGPIILNQYYWWKLYRINTISKSVL